MSTNDFYISMGYKMPLCILSLFKLKVRYIQIFEFVFIFFVFNAFYRIIDT